MGDTEEDEFKEKKFIKFIGYYGERINDKKQG